MAKIGTWSTTAGNNNAAPPDGWPEGQAPSTVNDCAREMMASIKTYINNAEYVDLNNTPSFLTATTFSMATADVANFEIGRRVKLFDATTLYGTVNSVSATFVSVRLDSGALTASLSSVAMAVVKESNNSLPNAVWRRKNIIINGQMNIWQRSATFAISGNAAAYTADRWKYIQNSEAAVKATRSERSANASNVPSLAQSGIFFTNALIVSVSTVDAVIAAAQYSVIDYFVEGYDWQQIAHKPMNLSFWCNTNKSGVYAVAFRSSNGSASCVQNFTISAVATWTKFSIPIPEAPTTPYPWDYSTGIGLEISFTLAAGTTYQGGAGNWTATNLLATSSQVNFLASANNIFALTGVQLEEGQAATPLEIRPYAQELAMCERYYRQISAGSVPTIVGQCISTNRALFDLPYGTTMRTAPTISYPAATSFVLLTSVGGTDTVSAITSNNIGRNSLRIDCNTQNSRLSAGNASELFFAPAPITLDADF